MIFFAATWLAFVMVIKTCLAALGTALGIVLGLALLGVLVVAIGKALFSSNKATCS